MLNTINNNLIFSFKKCISISFFNLMLVALLGVVMRYKIAYYFPYVEQKFLLQSHSHFAFAGWITQTLMVLLVHNLGLENGKNYFKKYNWLLAANLVTAYGMLISFLLQGYAFLSISFSTLSIFVSYFLAFFYWKELNKSYEKKISHLWFKAALIFNVISSIGAFYLAFMMTNKVMHQNWYLASIYFFLHFQYNGWFFFAGMGLLVSKLEIIDANKKNLKKAFLFFCFACIPAYFLSALWLPFPSIIYWLIIAAVIAQVAGWIMLLKVFFANKVYINQNFSKYGKVLLQLSAIAFTIKLILQTGSVHPALSQLSYGFRPIVIGYLHLVLLAVTSIYIIGYMVSLNIIKLTKKMITGIFVFVTGIIINELLLMMQGVAALSYNSIPYINILLLGAAIILFCGITLMFISYLKKTSANSAPSPQV